MLTKRRLIVLGSITFLVGLVVLFPARVAHRLFSPPELRLSAIHGTVWDGSAAEGQAVSLYLRNVRWSFKPLALFAGKFAFETSFEPAGGFLQATVAMGLNGSLTLSDVQGAVSIGAMQSVIPAPGIEGNVRLSFTKLRIDDGLPTEADGTVEVVGLIARGLASTPIGDFRVELVSTDDGIAGSVEDTAGMLDIAGALRVSADRTYSLSGLVAPTASTPQAVLNQLRFLGSANERGQREFRFEGQL